MRGFGRRKGGGRRSANRASTPTNALIRTIGSCHTAAVVDLSCTGVRLCGRDLPDEGQELELHIDALSAFGTVVWSARDECGIHFDVPLTDFDVAAVKWKVGLTTSTKLTVDERIALEEWTNGTAR